MIDKIMDKIAAVLVGVMISVWLDLGWLFTHPRADQFRVWFLHLHHVTQ